jgi:superfamily II DNA helicase RecQ
MSYRFFRIPQRAPEEFERDLNAFLRSHRVLSIDKRWVDLGQDSYWAFCVDYVETTASKSSSAAVGRDKIDYREKLSPEDFAVFAQLRDLRKELSQADSIPVYMVFTNGQLAAMVENRVTSKSELALIDGVGEARVEKYGDRFLELLGRQWNEKVDDAKSETPF